MIARVAAFALLAGAARGAASQAPVPGAHWDSISGDAARAWSADSLRAIGTWVAALGSGAVVVIEDGRLVAQWGEPARRFPLASVRKSLLNALIGIEVARGRLDTSATLASLGIDDVPPLSPTERTARTSDLLRARSGVYHESAYEPSSMRRNRPPRGSAQPGERWFYNNWDFNTLGAIYERASGLRTFDGFAREIAAPLGMEDYRPDDGAYVRESVSVFPAYTFRMSARDLARFLLLYLRGGRWGERLVVSADWVAASTRAISGAGESGAYGMLWWVERDGRLVPGARVGVGSFAARGNGPHYAIAIPSRKLIIVHLANTDTPSPANWVDAASIGVLVDRIVHARTGRNGPE